MESDKIRCGFCGRTMVLDAKRLRDEGLWHVDLRCPNCERVFSAEDVECDRAIDTVRCDMREAAANAKR